VASKRNHLGQLRTTLNRFAAKFPGEILPITPKGIDAWLRSFEVSATTRHSMLRCVKAFFAFVHGRTYLPEDKTTFADHIRLVKSAGEDVSVLTPEIMDRILHAAPPHLVPTLAIGPLSSIDSRSSLLVPSVSSMRTLRITASLGTSQIFTF
jgi:hypothetical protein